MGRSATEHVEGHGGDQPRRLGTLQALYHCGGRGVRGVVARAGREDQRERCENLGRDLEVLRYVRAGDGIRRGATRSLHRGSDGGRSGDAVTAPAAATAARSWRPARIRSQRSIQPLVGPVGRRRRRQEYRRQQARQRQVVGSGRDRSSYVVKLHGEGRDRTVTRSRRLDHGKAELGGGATGEGSTNGGDAREARYVTTNNRSTTTAIITLTARQ